MTVDTSASSQVVPATIALVLFVAIGMYLAHVGRATLRSGHFRNQKTGELITGRAARRLGLTLVGVGVVGSGITIICFILSVLYWIQS